MYIYNGENFTLDEIKMILGVEEITDAILAENGITLAEEATQVPDESKTVVENKGFFSDDFQQVTAAEDVPAVTETESTSKVFPDIQFEQEDVVTPLTEMQTSELELQLEDTSSFIASLEEKIEEAGGTFRASSTLVQELRNLERKKEKVSTQLNVRYTNKERLDFNNPMEPANQQEDRVVEEAKLVYPNLNIEPTGIGNEIVIKNYLNTGKDWNIKLDGSQEAIDAFKKLADDKKALQSGYDFYFKNAK